MKFFLTTLLLAMVASCAINSFFEWMGWTAKFSHVKLSTNITDVGPAGCGVFREDGAYPDIDMCDTSRQFRYIDAVQNGRHLKQLDWPYAGTY